MDKVSKLPPKFPAKLKALVSFKPLFRKRISGYVSKLPAKRLPRDGRAVSAYARNLLSLVTWKERKKVADFCGLKVTTPLGNMLVTWKLSLLGFGGHR